MEIVVASGKGGTGKTFLASNLAIFMDEEIGETLAIDADVEAPDLVLALGGEERIIWAEEVRESMKAVIDYRLCDRCMRCMDVCMFEAIKVMEDGRPSIIDELCEGCGACAYVCPAQAISFKRTLTGRIYSAETRSGITALTGDLEIGGRNSGELVYLLRRKAEELASRKRASRIVIDSAPGIGCPVISSLSGADLLIIVVEPIPQSLMGAERLLKIAEAFKLKTAYVVNKFNLNEGFVEKISERLELECIGKIPYDPKVPLSYTWMRPIIMYWPEAEAGRALKEVFEGLESWA